jgi:hypothetical protein
MIPHDFGNLRKNWESGPELQSDLPKVKVVTTYNWDRMKGQLYI